MPTICAFGGSADGLKFISSSTAPSDTSGKTIWYDTVNNLMKMYWNGAWHALNTYQPS